MDGERFEMRERAREPLETAVARVGDDPEQARRGVEVGRLVELALGRAGSSEVRQRQAVGCELDDHTAPGIDHVEGARRVERERAGLGEAREGFRADQQGVSRLGGGHGGQPHAREEETREPDHGAANDGLPAPVHAYRAAPYFAWSRSRPRYPISRRY